MICGKASSGCWTARRLLDYVKNETAIKVLREAQNRLILMAQSPEDLKTADIIRADAIEPQLRFEPAKLVHKLEAIGALSPQEGAFLERSLK